jgi:nicotinamide phosphoribosyltransferase
MNENILLMTDSYKVGHSVQYPPGTESVYSYFESRGGMYKETVFFGLQYIIEKYLTKRVTVDDVCEADWMFASHFGTDKLFNKAGWMKIVNEKDGFLPIRIKAVPEGTVVPVSNVLMTVENTDPEYAWLTNYLETILSQVWYPTTVATISYNVRKLILSYLEKTGTPEAIDFKLHDFGFRGVSSGESAAIGGGAHLTSFLGTDTLAALVFLRDYYDAVEPVAGFSVPASEHSTMTSWGREHEEDAFRNMIKQYGSYPIYSVVSDSYDIYNAATNLWGGSLKDEVLAAEGTLVVRPDSGDPPVVVIELLERLAKQFGAERNEKGYYVLNPKVRVIWGDGLDPAMIETILFRMHLKDWSADNIVFGMGGGLLQKVNRDTQKFAFKCSSVVVNGEERDVWKQPVTDAVKNSKRGRLGLYYNTDDGFSTQEEGYNFDLLETVFVNGRFSKKYSLSDVRTNNGMLARVAA